MIIGNDLRDGGIQAGRRFKFGAALLTRHQNRHRPESEGLAHALAEKERTNKAQARSSVSYQSK